AVDPALGAVAVPPRLVAGEVAVVAEHEPPRGIGERLRVGLPERGQARRPAQVDEQALRLDGADALACWVVAECPHVAVRLEPSVRRQPRGAPAESGDAEPLELLGEAPQLVDPERLPGAGDVMLTHDAR